MTVSKHPDVFQVQGGTGTPGKGMLLGNKKVPPSHARAAHGHLKYLLLNETNETPQATGTGSVRLHSRKGSYSWHRCGMQFGGLGMCHASAPPRAAGQRQMAQAAVPTQCPSACGRSILNALFLEGPTAG